MSKGRTKQLRKNARLLVLAISEGDFNFHPFDMPKTVVYLT
jgi:hypothetical protein